MSNVNSYREKTELYTDKHTILIYGLNGTGKSTLSNFLYDLNNPIYKECSIDGLLDSDEILVYNQHFVYENFYETDTLKGIFTLSKENKKIKQAIENANKDIEKIDQAIEQKRNELDSLGKKFDDIKKEIEEALWEVKIKYSGEDRVLDYCLKGLKSNKSKLFESVRGIDRQKEKPLQDVEEIKNEVMSLGESEDRVPFFSKVDLNVNLVENDTIFSKNIVGNKDSIVSQLINELGNSDWVKAGLNYIDLDAKRIIQPCPFCQEETVTSDLINNIKDFFDENYEKDILKLQDCLKQYENSYHKIEHINWVKNSAVKEQDILEIEKVFKNLLSMMEENIRKINEKIQMPSMIINLSKTEKLLQEVNDNIEGLNVKIRDYNHKINNKSEHLKALKKEFWKNIRWAYNGKIERFLEEESNYYKNKEEIERDIKQFLKVKANKKEFIAKEQRNTVNIDEAIVNINNGLLDLGIEEFRIVKANDKENLYKIVRKDNQINIFRSLSEGEKMLISFLYFVELCRGKKSASDVNKRKIVVIDDPITSMSHIYIFNVGRLIYNEFLRNNNYEQIFVMTHSLYFFYELTCMKKDDREEKQKLVRICKNSDGSRFLDMHYQEIQNDYQAYWSIIKDSEQPPALIANCMRNIIEYFFNFVEKAELSNVFQKKSLQATKYQAFYRYINRESHSLGQNIIDFKEFNYEDFKEAFRLVFEEAGYINHYKKMMK